MSKRITIFEHESLRLGDQGFDQRSLDALTRWQDRKGIQYFTRIHNGIKVNQWVGVIQSPSITLEILPKADRPTNENRTDSQDCQDKWRSILLTMIQWAFGIAPEFHFDAQMQIRRANILDILADAFLLNVDDLVKSGLIKKYRWQDDLRSSAIRGRFLIEKQIKHNVGHDEQFACRINSYDKCNLLNGIIKTAILVLKTANIATGKQDRLVSLANFFEDIPASCPSEDSFKTIKWDRKSERYFKAISLARLILFSLSPDFYSGNEKIFTLLFDMNELFEMYVSSHLHYAVRNSSTKVRLQKSYSFWEQKRIRPDIVFEENGRKMTVDTKWKILTGNKPSDDDLKQIYVYNRIVGCDHSILLYPTIDIEKDKGVVTDIRKGKYKDNLYCSLWSINLFKQAETGEYVPNKKIGSALLESLILAI